MDIERYYGPKLRPFNILSKPVKILCDRHLEWIRKQPCIITGESGGSEGDKIVAHHVQLKSHGTVDYLTVPMKSRLHDNAHAQCQQGRDGLQINPAHGCTPLSMTSSDKLSNTGWVKSNSGCG